MALRLLSSTLVTVPKLQVSKKRDGFTKARVSSSSSISRVSGRIGSIKCQALGESSVDGVVYQGTYGPWTVDSSDVREVLRRPLRRPLVLFLNLWIFCAVCLWN